MLKHKTSDDIETVIGYKEPVNTWQGKLREDQGYYAEREGTIVSNFFPSIFDAMWAYPDAIISPDAMSQLSTGEKRMLGKPASPPIQKAGAENLVSISEKFHTHPQYHAFYECYCDTMNGFLGIYDLIIRMAETLTNWEEKKGGNELYDRTEIIWDELVDTYVDKYFKTALRNDDRILPSAEDVFKTIEPKKSTRRQPKRPAGIITQDKPEP